MTEYERRKVDRIERFTELADKAKTRSAAGFEAAHDAIAGIPLGQPILVGHHSERRHRRALELHDNKMRRALAENAKARHYANRADGAESRDAIDSDDPEAVAKMRAKIADLEATQNHDRAVNAAWRRAGRPEPDDEPGWRRVLEILTADGSALEWSVLAKIRLDMARGRQWGQGRQPIESYVLSNNNANLRRCRERLADLERMPVEGRDEATTTEYGPVTVTVDPEEGRVFVRTPGRNEQATEILRGAGWQWSRSRGCWSRKLTTNAIEAAKMIGPKLENVYGGRDDDQD
jgi:hypothetical protein